jgi:hypothetical protein
VEDAAFGDPAAFFDGFAGGIGPAIEGFPIEEIGEAIVGVTGGDEGEESERTDFLVCASSELINR